MFDPYSQMSAHARKEAFLHPWKFMTWQDVVRENHDTDVNFESGSFFSEGLLRSLPGLYKPILGLTIIVILAFSDCTPPRSQPTIDSISTQANMPNPASVFCEEQGYKLEVRTAADGSQSGVCIFPDRSECDESAYFHNECEPAMQNGTSSSRTAIPTAMPIDPADYQQGWWTYKHPVYGFSIMLPEDWVVEETTTSDPLISGHSLSLHPNYEDKQNIHMAFRRVGEDVGLWPTGVGQGEFIEQGTLDIADQLARRFLLVCPNRDVTASGITVQTRLNPTLPAEIWSSGSFTARAITVNLGSAWPAKSSTGARWLSPRSMYLNCSELIRIPKPVK